MAYMKAKRGYGLPSFLESVVGLVQKTEMITRGMATIVDNKKLIYARTAFPSNDPRATGIVFETVDMTDDVSRPAGVVKAGRIYGNRLETPLSSETKAVLGKRRFVILDTPECKFQLEV